MILHALPDPEDVRLQLMDVTTAFWVALEHGLSKTRDYFEQEGTEIDPYLAANIARYHARLYLETHQHDAAFERIEVANCGLRVVAIRTDHRFDVWVRKSDDGELPVPQSDHQLAFYHQPVMIGFYSDSPAPGMQTVSLVALWETPKSYSHVTSLSLVCPAAGGEVRADVQAHWSISIPHPMTTHIHGEVGDASDEPADDIPMDDNIEDTGDSSSGDDGDDE